MAPFPRPLVQGHYCLGHPEALENGMHAYTSRAVETATILVIGTPYPLYSAGTRLDVTGRVARWSYTQDFGSVRPMIILVLSCTELGSLALYHQPQYVVTGALLSTTPVPFDQLLVVLRPPGPTDLLLHLFLTTSEAGILENSPGVMVRIMACNCTLAPASHWTGIVIGYATWSMQPSSQTKLVSIEYESDKCTSSAKILKLSGVTEQQWQDLFEGELSDCD